MEPVGYVVGRADVEHMIAPLRLVTYRRHPFGGMMKIILRTVCACERIITIPDKTFPPYYAVPYVRLPQGGIAWNNDSAPPQSIPYRKRTFERTPVRGIYDYVVYLEVLSE